ncbi:Ser/Thr phosphatase family protein [delta proteobacterium NaphS2]|nr:Ser/Thr phosphatase family protein [delta proteobacterium NaphS2]
MRMAIFLSIFITLYGSLHFYAFMKTGRAFGFHKGLALPLLLFMVFMVVCPILVRMAEHNGMESLGRILAYVGYIWMGFLFLFFVVAALLDIYTGLVLLISRILDGSLAKWTLSPKALFFVSLSVSLAGGAYGLLEASMIRTEHLVVKSPEFPEKMGRFRVVQISDVHLGLIVGKRRLSHILNLVRAAKPDILVSTGDLLDGQIDGIKDLAKAFQTINPPYGKFAVNGNHEYYVGIDRARRFCKWAGFTLLNDAAVDIPGVLVIAGIDDMTAERFGASGNIKEKTLLSKWPKKEFLLVLKHRPVLDTKSEGLFDLQLSGHTHNGQLFPFSLIVRMIFPIGAGLLNLPDGAALYVSRGSGTWGPPMRLFSPPEVTIIDLVHGKRKRVDLQKGSD